ncbi:hypothetical protein BDM02DRAFT_1852208 [Thelephora ganbajun]|uniref:Uncharacterized protein n=1 Tax=Thelephora ganbajun TaxID=370292 RepID=A0ACB6ZIK5_THEGA|nr:hypothetical protein BDM02DRAFT_1852208 [Thelephora ganbajun]
MPDFFESIPDHLIPWLLDQHVFWVASAPLSKDGHINLSPKGVKGSFQVNNPNEVWYEDLTGSGMSLSWVVRSTDTRVLILGLGVETIAHARENGRITLLFCALSGPPRIVRLFGRATVHEFGTPEYAALIDPATRQPSSRSVILIHVWKVGTSCGWGVPLFEFQAQRTTHQRWAVQSQNRDFDYEAKKSGSSEVKADEYPDKGVRYYQALLNQKSLDGLSGLQVAFKAPLTSVIKERLQPITQPPALSKVRKEQKEKECKSECEPTEAEDAVTLIKKKVEGKSVLLAFVFGLAVATYLPPAARAIGSNIFDASNSTFRLPTL